MTTPFEEKYLLSITTLRHINNLNKINTHKKDQCVIYSVLFLLYLFYVSYDSNLIWNFMSNMSVQNRFIYMYNPTYYDKNAIVYELFG